jgi:hypothetical protein
VITFVHHVTCFQRLCLQNLSHADEFGPFNSC